MASREEVDDVGDDAYDEEADSDFDANQAVDPAISSSEEEDADTPQVKDHATHQKKHNNRGKNVIIEELDSGDEATIREHEKNKRRHKRKEKEADSGDESEGWRARTRAMRLQDKVEQKRNKLATSKGSTIDVDKIWEDMNKPGPLPAIRSEGAEEVGVQVPSAEHDEGQNKENEPVSVTEEMITIKRKYNFAGEVHVEEKTVPKSSAEARLWLSQQENKLQIAVEAENGMQRPLRKISRFDPNYNNLGAFKTNWAPNIASEGNLKGPKLNVVEKSKMDWASHVDAEGLKDELDVHAKAKEGYHSRMDFLNQVEQRKEEEARLARMKK